MTICMIFQASSSFKQFKLSFVSSIKRDMQLYFLSDILHIFVHFHNFQIPQNYDQN